MFSEVFFFKQKTAYEMRISDWSSDVCSSDLASAVEIALPTSGGLTGMLTTDQSERYELHIVVEMQVLDGRQIQGNARAEARRSLTVAEDSSLKEREEVWYRLTAQTMRDPDQQLAQTIHLEERRGGKEWVGTCRSREGA